jgi:hypothetical protein
VELSEKNESLTDGSFLCPKMIPSEIIISLMNSKK